MLNRRNNYQQIFVLLCITTPTLSMSSKISDVFNIVGTTPILRSPPPLPSEIKKVNESSTTSSPRSTAETGLKNGLQSSSTQESITKRTISSSRNVNTSLEFESDILGVKKPCNNLRHLAHHYWLTRCHTLFELSQNFSATSNHSPFKLSSIINASRHGFGLPLLICNLSKRHNTTDSPRFDSSTTLNSDYNADSNQSIVQQLLTFISSSDSTSSDHENFLKLQVLTSNGIIFPNEDHEAYIDPIELALDISEIQIQQQLDSSTNLDRSTFLEQLMSIAPQNRKADRQQKVFNSSCISTQAMLSNANNILCLRPFRIPSNLKQKATDYIDDLQKKSKVFNWNIRWSSYFRFTILHGKFIYGNHMQLNYVRQLFRHLKSSSSPHLELQEGVLS